MVTSAAPDIFGDARRRMVERQLVRRGIADPRVLAAMRKVPREQFVSAEQAAFAYADGPLPIGEAQTISQPYIVARMAEVAMLSPADRVLEIGTGSGYSAAVLAEIVTEVYTIERLPRLAERARQRLTALGYRRVHVLTGDGTLGWPDHAPYDAIIATAGGPHAPASLLDQLAVGGRLVIPLGPDRYEQRLVRVIRVTDDDYRRQTLDPVAFVPLIGAQGWHTASSPT
ncbi:MAG TPA: protein-L-isoaspartate(D-aspartate) O-methyltransferase [Methylomirabilota bacterium]|nr:protein-L-isoaspartate(D-aspartate) O-methyltransferase [Methylomirabilota bacterium]